MEENQRRERIPKKVSITISVGKVEKEVQNIQAKTSVTDVIAALVRDSQQEIKEKCNSQWVIVEAWRGGERPLPPRTKLLRVWHSWGEERKNVRFSLRRAEKTWTFSRSSSKRRKLRKVDGPEVFIDGPCGEIKEDQRSISDDSISESGSTSSAHSFTSDSTISEVEENNKDDRLNLLNEVEKNKLQLESFDTKMAELNSAILRAEAEILKSEKQKNISETRERIDLIEARISSAKSVTAELSESIEIQRKIKRRIAPSEEVKIQNLKEKIEAQLMVNLILARNTDQIDERLEKVENSISARQLLLVTTLENFEQISQNDLNLSESLPIIDECIDHHDCPDCRLGTPLHFKLTSNDLCENELKKYGSDSSFSDSAIGSVKSNQNLKNDFVAQSLV